MKKMEHKIFYYDFKQKLKQKLKATICKLSLFSSWWKKRRYIKNYEGKHWIEPSLKEYKSYSSFRLLNFHHSNQQ